MPRAALLILLLAAGCAGAPARLPDDAASLERLLLQTRPRGAASYRARASILWRLGRRELAVREAKLGLVLDPRSAGGQRQAGQMEAALGNEGEALRRLERAHLLDPGDAPARTSLARLLLRRASALADPVVGLLRPAAARQDMRRAAQLDPSLTGQACALRQRLGRLDLAWKEPPDRRRLMARGGDPYRGTVGCPGPPRGLGVALGPLDPRGRCRLERPERFLQQIRRRYLLLGCAGAQLAVRLERWGCLDRAAAVWGALAEEDPADARWPLQQARILLAREERDRAEALLTAHVALSPLHAAAMLRTARILLQAGHQAAAARRATRAVDLAANLTETYAPLALMRQAGFRQEAEQAARRAAARFRGGATPR